MRSFNEYVYTYEVIEHVPNQDKKKSEHHGKLFENFYPSCSPLSQFLQFLPQFNVFEISDAYIFWESICLLCANDFENEFCSSFIQRIWKK